MLNEDIAVGILLVVCGVLFVWALRVTVDWRESAKKLMGLQFANPHARLLGRTVEVKVYEGSEWERMVVVAVSWQGAVAVRPEHDPYVRARWIPKDKAPNRVREVER